MHQSLARALALLLAGCAACGPTAKRPAPDPTVPELGGKVRAPVRVEATLADGAGRVTVRLEAAATDVRVEVWGVDGLVVSSAATPLAGARFEAGDAIAFEVLYAAPPGASALALSVSGDFGGSRRATVVSFEVKTPAAPRSNGLTGGEAGRPGTTVETDDGDRVKVLTPRE